MASFPNEVRKFPRHQNLVDDVNADHINAIQDEVVAIQQALGTLLREVPPNAVSVPTPPKPAPSVTMAPVDSAPLPTRGEYQTLVDRINALEPARYRSAFSGAFQVAESYVSSNFNRRDDPDGFFTTHNFKIPYSGLWHFSGEIDSPLYYDFNPYQTYLQNRNLPRTVRGVILVSPKGSGDPNRFVLDSDVQHLDYDYRLARPQIFYNNVFGRYGSNFHFNLGGLVWLDKGTLVQLGVNGYQDQPNNYYYRIGAKYRFSGCRVREFPDGRV